MKYFFKQKMVFFSGFWLNSSGFSYMILTIQMYLIWATF